MGSPLIFEFQINNTYIFSYKCSPNIAWDACTLKKLFAICLKSKSITALHFYLLETVYSSPVILIFFFSPIEFSKYSWCIWLVKQAQWLWLSCLILAYFQWTSHFFFFTPLGMLLKQWLYYENNSHPKVFELRIYSLERTCHWGFRNHCLTLCFPTFDAF